MTTIEDILLIALTEQGKKYIFGAEVLPTNLDPYAFDCSELVEYSCERAGLGDTPDGAYNQWNWTKNAGLAIPVEQARSTRGALLFSGDGVGVGRDAIYHVAFSLGNHTTIEARGTAYGVGSFTSVGRFNFGGLIPNVSYGAPGVPLPQLVPPFGGRIITQPPIMNGEDVRIWQAQMAYRGWSIVADGSYGPKSEDICRKFQAEKSLRIDGEIGPITWAATWTAPVT